MPQSSSALPNGSPLWPDPQPEPAPRRPPTMKELGLNRAERRRLSKSKNQKRRR